MSLSIPRTPSAREWLERRVSGPTELHAGKQSRVFLAAVDEKRTVVKLTDRSLTDRSVLTARMQAAEALAADLPGIVAPLRIDGELVQPIGDWWMTSTPFVDGDQPDIANPDDARLMGQTLARLHDAMAELPVHEIPPIAALGFSDGGVDRSAWQLLHGDFSELNVISTSTGLSIFDFDDCGYGPVEYDLANSLYMVMFGSEVKGLPARYEAFRPAFLGGYLDWAASTVTDAGIDDMIATRIRALSGWLDDLSSAPIGIRTSSPAWLETLESFVRAHRPDK